MKKYKFLVFIIPILVLVLFFSFAATCSSSSDTAKKVDNTTSGTTTETIATATTEVSETTASAPTTAQSIFNVGESVDLNGTVVTVTKFKKSNGSDFDKPKAGMEYVIVTIKINNNGDSKVSYNPFDFKMQNSKGQITDMAFTIVDQDTALQSGELALNGEVEGTVTFEEPKNDPELTLLYQPNFFNENVAIKFSIK